MVSGGLVPDRFVGPTLACKDRVLRFDRLVRTGRRRDLDELAEKLTAEYSVVLQLLIATLEFGDVVVGALTFGATRRHRLKIKACE